MVGSAVLELDPQNYLSEIFPALLRSSSLPPPRDEAVIQFVVRDEDECDWFYRVTPSGVETVRGISDQVDLTLAFYSRDLTAFGAGKLDVNRAVRSGRLSVHGDDAVLRWLSARLEVQS